MNRRKLAFVAVFCLGALAGAILSGALAQARTTPSTAFKNTPELLGILANQNYETQNLLDRIIELERKQFDEQKRITELARDQLDEQKAINRLVQDLKRLVERH